MAAAGMLLTGYLSYSALSGAATMFCAAGSSCELIQHSRWSRLFGLPLPIWGLALYAVLAFNAWRLPARLQRWRRLWLVALVGLAASLYLGLVGWRELDAFCVWCLLSMTLLVAIFLRIALKRPAAAPGGSWRVWLGYSGLAVLLSVGGMQLHYSDLLQARADPQLVALAKHLERRGVRFYGAFWCAACQEQKRLFGSAAQHLPYVECSPAGRRGLVERACIEAGISGYPTWIIRGRRFQQLLSTEELTRYSGFTWEQEE
ncbi:vitamin K epoxide reductase family protein [Pseudomonas sp. CrR25]|nr:vitamin K epoxide reductase family protein [Pseudomonas sp. CrR25]